MVLLEELGHVHDQVAYHGQAWQGAQFHGLLQPREWRDAGQARCDR